MTVTTKPAAARPERGYDFGLDNPEWDYPPPATRAVQYLILSSPRSGSTMLSSALVTSRRAGVPIEYFHFDTLKKFGQNPPPAQVMRHFDEVRRRRTTPNGVFGMKLHGGQFRTPFMRPQMTPEGIVFLKSFTHAILITRKDKVAQAMSYLRSLKSGLWNSSLASDRGSARYVLAEEDMPELCRVMSVFLGDEMMWKQITTIMKYNVLHITYEALSANPSAVLGDVFRFLGVEYDGQLPTTQRLSEDDYAAQKAQFMKAIGA